MVIYFSDMNKKISVLFVLLGVFSSVRSECNFNKTCSFKGWEEYDCKYIYLFKISSYM